MAESAPNVVVLAGPNGAGKSTSAPSILKDALGVDEFVNADVIAQGLSGFEPERAATRRRADHARTAPRAGPPAGAASHSRRPWPAVRSLPGSRT